MALEYGSLGYGSVRMAITTLALEDALDDDKESSCAVPHPLAKNTNTENPLL